MFCPEIGSFNNEIEQLTKRDKRMDKKDVFRENLKKWGREARGEASCQIRRLLCGGDSRSREHGCGLPILPPRVRRRGEPLRRHCGGDRQGGGEGDGGESRSYGGQGGRGCHGGVAQTAGCGGRPQGSGHQCRGGGGVLVSGPEGADMPS